MRPKTKVKKMKTWNHRDGSRTADAKAKSKTRRAQRRLKAGNR
jgi:hypothetical protein